jgi:HTH-type transcriptional regulator / antitoxin HigA
MGALAIDDKKYARVLAKVLPRVITTTREYERLLTEVEKLMDKGGQRSKEEDAALDLLVRLIRDYDEQHHRLPDPSPIEMLAHLMEKRGLKQADLVPIFKSRGYVSDVINGKRAISKAHARQLADFFNISADVFI